MLRQRRKFANTRWDHRPQWAAGQAQAAPQTLPPTVQISTDTVVFVFFSIFPLKNGILTHNEDSPTARRDGKSC